MQLLALFWLIVFCCASAVAQQSSTSLDPAIRGSFSIKPVWEKGATPLNTNDLNGAFQKDVYKPTVRILYQKWLRSIPKEAKPPKCVQANSEVEFDLLPDGKITNERLLSSSGSKKFDKHALHAVKKSKFKSFPHYLGLREVVFRVRFEVNPKTDPANTLCQGK